MKLVLWLIAFPILVVLETIVMSVQVTLHYFSLPTKVWHLINNLKFEKGD